MSAITPEAILGPALMSALDAAGYVVRKKPATRRTVTPVEAFAPNAGDLRVDAFMRKHHRHDWETHQRRAFASRTGMIPMPSPAPGRSKKRPMTQSERDALYAYFNVVYTDLAAE